MDQQELFKPIPCDKFDLLSKEELIDLSKGLQDFNNQLQKALIEANNKILSGEQKSFLLNESLINIKNKLFGKSSEKSNKGSDKDRRRREKQARKRVLLPSDRYPNVDIIEKDIEFDELPGCPCCGAQMEDSGLTEDSEYLSVIPKKFYVVKQKRHKYRCRSCQGALVTAPAIPRITPGSSYSDEMVVDVAMSKYLDLIPIERYVQMASRSGVSGLAQNSLIELTHRLAMFTRPVYEGIKKLLLESKILHADETPQRMLEGDKKSNWYYWGFSNDKASYFEARDTRSGEVAADLLKESKCQYLMTDVFSGYARAVNETNEHRVKQNLEKLIGLNCNAHARRKFKESEGNFSEESDFFIRLYRKIYRLEKPDKQDPLWRRSWQKLYMRVMDRRCQRIKSSYPRDSSIGKAVRYFSNNFEGLVGFTKDPILPIDNNAQERLLRSHVVGRKTWLGVHSRKGAETASMMFSIVETCKLNEVNPREYLKELIRDVHQEKPYFLPHEFKQRSFV